MATRQSQEEKQGRYKKPRIEFFLSNFIAGQIAGEVNLSKLFSEYKAFVKSAAYPNVAAELTELGRYGAIYREIVERSSDTTLGNFSHQLEPWDVTTVFPLVMRIWASDMSSSEKTSCLSQRLAYLVRRAICGLTTKNYNKFFLNGIANLTENGFGLAQLTGFLLDQKGESSRLPRDEEFEQRWLSTPVYNTLQPARTRAVLEAIEKAKRGKFHETKVLAPHLTVEHILPQQWLENWPLPGGDVVSNEQYLNAYYSTNEDDSLSGRIVRRNRLKETFGNLTLLTQPLNSTVQNAAFDVKRAALEEHSLLVLSREVVKRTTWDEDAILERGRALFNVAVKLWPLPEQESFSLTSG